VIEANEAFEAIEASEWRSYIWLLSGA